MTSDVCVAKGLI